MYINGEGWGETGQKMDFLLQTSLIKMLYAHYIILNTVSAESKNLMVQRNNIWNENHKGKSKKNHLWFIFKVCLFVCLTILDWHVKHQNYNIQIQQFFKTKQQNKKKEPQQDMQH